MRNDPYSYPSHSYTPATTSYAPHASTSYASRPMNSNSSQVSPSIQMACHSDINIMNNFSGLDLQPIARLLIRSLVNQKQVLRMVLGCNTIGFKWGMSPPRSFLAIWSSKKPVLLMELVIFGVGGKVALTQWGSPTSRNW